MLKQMLPGIDFDSVQDDLKKFVQSAQLIAERTKEINDKLDQLLAINGNGKQVYHVEPETVNQIGVADEK